MQATQHRVSHRATSSVLSGQLRLSLDTAAEDQQASILMCRERKRLATGWLATKAVGQVVVASAAAVERAVDGGGPRIDLLVGDHLGTPVA